jgi:hypothetical protein
MLGGGSCSRYCKHSWRCKPLSGNRTRTIVTALGVDSAKKGNLWNGNPLKNVTRNPYSSV